MCVRKLINYLASTMLVLPLILGATASWGDDQLLSEVAVGGRDAGGNGDVVSPDLADTDPDFSYTDWVTTPVADLDIRAVTFSTRGLIVLDGNVLREFGPPRFDDDENPIDNEKVGDAFPVDCTKLKFIIPKGGRGDVFKDEFLSTCSAVVALNDGTLRVLGQSKGKSFVSIAYDPADSGCPAVDPDPLESRICDAVRMADGTPPQITDAINDESDAAATRGGPSYWALGERKKLIRFSPLAADPAVRDSEQFFDVVATLSGLKLDGLAPYGDNQVIVADDDGRLLAVDTDSGSYELFYSGTVCEPLGKKTPQKFSVRGDSEGDFLYFANQACGTLTVLNSSGVEVDENGDPDPGRPPFLFDNDSLFDTDPPMDPILGVPDGFADFNPEALTLRTGQSGDFGDCTGGDVSAACQLAIQNNGARQFATVLRPGPDSSFRGFQFVLNDCRHSGIQPCPITNCETAAVGTIHEGDGIGCLAEDANDQNLDIMQLALSADTSGEFRQLLDDPDNPPVITLPGYLRAEKEFPNNDPDPLFLDNEWTFYWIFLFSDAVFDNVFRTQYDLDVLRGDGGETLGDDPCDKLDPFSDIADVNERTNVIAYTPSTYNTIVRPGQDIDPDHKGATVINWFCNRSGGSSFNWSGQVVGIEFTKGDPDPDTGIADPETFLDFTLLQMNELQRAKDELLCNENLEIPPGGPTQRLLSVSDCEVLIQPELDQMLLKLQTCHDAARVIQGGSEENCNALFTKIGNLRTRLDFEVTWPAPAVFDPEDPDADLFRLVRPNYEGEFKSRLNAFEFALTDWFLPSIPQNGIDAPILAPIGDRSVDEGVELVVDLLAIDPNGDVKTLTASGLPGFCLLTDNTDGTGNITCNPLDGHDGIYPTTVTVTDDGERSPEDSETFDIVVNDVLP
jgi:hypothetical protein